MEFALRVVLVADVFDELVVFGGEDVEEDISEVVEGDARDESGSRTYEHG